MKYVDFTVAGNPATARDTVSAALVDRRFTVTWSDDWTGVAERGNRVANVFFGAFAQYFKVGISVSSGADGHCVVHVERNNSGLAGGAIGAARTRRNMTSLKDELTEILSAAGVLAGVGEG